MNKILLTINFMILVLIAKEGSAASDAIDWKGVTNTLQDLEKNRVISKKFLSDNVEESTQDEDNEEAEEEELEEEQSSAEQDPTFLSSSGGMSPQTMQLMMAMMNRRRPAPRPTIHVHNPAKKSSCLSPLNTVLLKGGKKVPLKNLRIGDEVQTWVNGKIVYSRFIALSHADANNLASYKRVTVESKAWVELTDDHLIFTKQAPTKGLQARKLKIGDSIWSKSPETGLMRLENITRIENVVREGYYAPITYAGTLFAGDILVSSYSTDASDGTAWLTSHQTLHYLAAPVRFLDNLNFGKAFRLDGSIDRIFNNIVGAMEFLSSTKQLFAP